MKARHYLSGYQWAATAEEVGKVVGHRGPVLLGLPWFEGLEWPNDHGRITVHGARKGRHALLARGVNARDHLILVLNSRGRFWGQNGSAWISFEDLDQLLADDGEACVPVY